MEGEIVGTYDPMFAVRGAAEAVAVAAKDVAGGRAAWDRPADAANSLERMDHLVSALADLLRQQADALPKLTADPQAVQAAGLVTEAAATAVKLGEQLRKAGGVARDVR
ncbi:hypothetical protein KCH_68450 [Kitasatospora cheerisanensis KCTC 2395]|uniref:Uncharacterized protein n=1 Tax=Kitasatospora cheerisanensis KCTC 2395 TaxID=1348663 RepID=A0A066YIT3_9ACTN|nr:hypothetical protein KCH_68450 [Kitasatospora cheerisanensis KCTC 2395]